MLVTSSSPLTPTHFDEAGRRHGELDAHCSRLHQIIVGRAAQELLQSSTLPESGTLHILPSWCWKFSAIDVGRKDKASSGRLLLPVRLAWSGGAVQLGARTSLVSGRAVGLGHDFTIKDEAASIVSDHSISGSGVQLRDHLAGLVARGNDAEWETFLNLEGMVRRRVQVAQTNVAIEIAGDPLTAGPVQDEIELEEVINRMMFGYDPVAEAKDMDAAFYSREAAEPIADVLRANSSVFRTIDACLEPETFRKVDPLKYISERLRVDAEATIRKRIDDPHIGAKVRKVARELHERASYDEIIAEYRRRYPGDHLAERRAKRALTVLPSPNARASSEESAMALAEHQRAA